MCEHTKICIKEWIFMYITRDSYLQKLKQSMGNDMVKIITGPRRCGKSFLLFHIFKDYLLSIGVKQDHIIELCLDDVDNHIYRNPFNLSSYFENKVNDDNQYYFLIDEIQLCEKVINPAFNGYKTVDKSTPLVTFYDVLNGFLHMKNVDVFVTGSNSYMLSSDIATEFRGRGWQIRIHPLTFKEFKEANKNRNLDNMTLWKEYYLYGGLPQISLLPDEPSKRAYLESVFNNTYINDIIERHSLRGEPIIKDLTKVMATNVGSIVNPTRIANTFKSEMKSSIQPITVSRYIDYMEDSFLIKQALRYDLKGRKFINTSRKYYFEDIGLRNARLGFRQVEQTHIMENIVYNELCMRGYSVDVGVVTERGKSSNGSDVRKQLEVDFVANRGGQRCYIQSAYQLPTPEKIAQEKASLLGIDDSFQKVILVRDVVKPIRDEHGILTMSVYDFLMDRNSLGF